MKYCQYYSGDLLACQKAVIKTQICSDCFYQPFVCLKANFGPLTRRQPHSFDSTFTQPYSALFQERPEGHLEPRNKVGFQSLQERISGIRIQPSNSECNVLPNCVTLPKSTLERIDHRTPSFFSRNCWSFSLALTTSHTLSQCYYSNIKQVNVVCEVHC